MNLKEVTPDEERAAVASLRRDGITVPLCWGDECRCPKDAPFFFNFAHEGVFCAEHFNQRLRQFN